LSQRAQDMNTRLQARRVGQLRQQMNQPSRANVLADHPVGQQRDPESFQRRKPQRVEIVATEYRAVGPLLDCMPQDVGPSQQVGTMELVDHAMFQEQIHFEAGTLSPVIDSVFPLARAADAHRRMESAFNVGKIILVTDEVDVRHPKAA
jgi:NADPH:quinone reductase-like Zn-dependent oxidoreductase